MKYLSFFLVLGNLLRVMYAQEVSNVTQMVSLTIAEEECATYPTGYEGLMQFIQKEVK